MTTTGQLLRVWNGKTIRQRADGWMSLTDMCQACDKHFTHWYNLKDTQGYIAFREGNNGIPSLEVNVGGDCAGTWGEPEMAIDLAKWLSYAFRDQVNIWICELLEKGVVRKDEVPVTDPNVAMLMQLMQQMLGTVEQSNDRPLMGRKLDDPEHRIRSVRKEYEDSIKTMRMAGNHVPGAERAMHLFYQTKLKQLSEGDALNLSDDVWVDVLIKGKTKTAVNLTRFERQLSEYQYIASREAAAIFDQKELWAPLPFTTTSARNLLMKAGWEVVADSNNKVAGRRKQSACHDHYWMRSTDLHLLEGGTIEPHDLDIRRLAYENMLEEATVCSVSTQAVQMAWNTSHLGKEIYMTGMKVGLALKRLGFTPHQRDAGTVKDSFWDFPADS